MKSRLQFRLPHLIALITLCALGLGYLSWTGYFFRNGIWEVESIRVGENWSHGVDVDSGESWFMTEYDYTAVCRDGDKTLDLTIGLYNEPVADPKSLPLGVGDSFRFVKSADRADAIELPRGRLVVKSGTARGW